jgi:hypothetical protein
MENKNIICRCCHANVEPIFNAKLLNNKVQYFECKNCDYVQTETPTWLDEAYANPINTSDTGIMERNVGNSRLVSGVVKLLKIKGKTVVDFAGGYGILVRLLRDKGINALWSDGYCKNLLASGFEYQDQAAELVTAFEVFEHFVDAQAELTKLFKIAPNLLISTLLIPSPSPNGENWLYYGFEHGQHIGFFRIASLQYLANQNNKYLYSDGKAYHLFTSKPISKLAWKMAVFKVKIVSYISSKLIDSLTMQDQQSAISQRLGNMN